MMKPVSSAFLLLLSFIIIGCNTSRITQTSQTDISPKYITRETALDKISSGALVIDVRTPDEYKTGHIDNSLNIPHDEIESRISELGSPSDKEIILYCGSGRRAGLAQNVLIKHDFTRVYNAGGYKDLK